MENIIKFNKNRMDDIIFLAFISIMPVFAVGFLALIMVFLLNPIKNNYIGLIQTWIAMPLGFCLLPYIFINKYYKDLKDLKSLGLVKPKLIEVIFVLIVLILFYSYLISKTNDINKIILLSIQTLAVAISEEFWARGSLFYVLKKITKNQIIIILISSLVFAFITHLNRGFLENLIYRFPSAILLGLVYLKTGKLQYPILIHFINNMTTII